jgi:hypothetical protein
VTHYKRSPYRAAEYFNRTFLSTETSHRDFLKESMLYIADIFSDETKVGPEHVEAYERRYNPYISTGQVNAFLGRCDRSVFTRD